ncbi:MAG TPA: Spy/CpxP family protein refolding chaperone [Thermoanaerobaculia bacterium]|nr:Spy/CpxP family protein refolding chaperone [Thermoanaerobaculia bacterium]
MKRTLIPALALGAAFSLLVASAATARPDFGRGGRGHGRGGSEQRIEFLAEYLSLTAAQKASIQKLQDALEARIEPLREEQKRLHGEVRGALDNDADAATVGALVIAQHEGREKIHALMEEHATQIEAQLTPAQVSRWNALKDARRARRGSHDVPPPAED